MKQRHLKQQIRQLARRHGVQARLVRQGKHEIWECAGLTFPIPRHREIAEGTARIILRRLESHLSEHEENR
jgi:hypothetical protein